MLEKNQMIRSAYLAQAGLEKQLMNEVKGRVGQVGRLILSSRPPEHSLWACNIWQNVEMIPIESIKHGARSLKERGRLWNPLYEKHIRRAKLIQKELPYFAGKRAEFLQEVPSSSLGSWTLLNEKTILASSQCSSPRPNGEWEFEEDKEGPPSRAYLKLWELFTRFGFHPQKSDTCLEVGGSPGGWTWVLAKLCREVITLDRAPLDDRIGRLPNVKASLGDAFAITPEQYPQVDWIFSDVICTPERIYQWLHPWFADSKARNYCITVKLKGDNYQPWIEKFRSIPGGHLVHLYHNKHELTFFRLDQSESS